MKIAVTATSGSMNAQVAQNFGRCPYFLIIESENMQFEMLQNPAASMMGGAGPAAAKAINEKGCDVLLTGVVGPNALKALEQYGIKIIEKVSGTVKEAVDRYMKDPG